MYFKEEFFWSFLEKLEIIKPDSKLLEPGFLSTTYLLLDSITHFINNPVSFVSSTDFTTSLPSIYLQNYESPSLPFFIKGGLGDLIFVVGLSQRDVPKASLRELRQMDCDNCCVALVVYSCIICIL
jgi:hypothetical protein